MKAIEFIIGTAYKYYEIEDSNDNKIKSSDEVDEFVHSAQCLTVAAYRKDDKVSFCKTVKEVQKESIIFYKHDAVTLTRADYLKYVGVVPLPRTPIESFYQCIRCVYRPLLLSDNLILDAKMQDTLSQLETGLRNIIYGKGNQNNTTVVLSVEDELEYWKMISNGNHSHNRKETANAFVGILEQLCDELRSLQTDNLSDIQETMESAGGLLDDLWRHSTYIYPQERMTHLIDIIGNLCITKLQKLLSSMDIWNSHSSTEDNQILATLNNCVQAMGVWLSASSTLTHLYWPNHALHSWQGSSYIPEHCKMFHERLQKVRDVRLVHQQLTKLLTEAEQLDLNTAAMFEPFQKLNVWICTPSAKNNWYDAVSYYRSILKPAESRIAEKLKPRLNNTSVKQTLYEFVRYRALIERPNVKQALHSELEMFVSSLGTLLQEIQEQMDSEKEFLANNYRAPGLSKLVHQIQWAKQMETRAMEIQNVADSLLSEFDGYKNLCTSAAKTRDELKQNYTHLYENWTRDLQAELSSGSLHLSPNTPVVEFSPSSNLMQVTFNPRLTELQQETRQMAALGMPPPPAVREAIDRAAQFLQQARLLQQVANFHNTQGERMISSTKPMMLEAAVHLASLVQEQKAVYWNDVKAVSDYADTLKEAVSKLVKQNTYLTSRHIEIRNIVVKLMGADLLGKQNEWKSGVREIRDIVEQVESEGYKNTSSWRVHWDMQLYKALECQYVRTLLSIHKHFPTVRVELIFRTQKVHIQPPVEELRVQHYNQLRRLVSLPLHFAGLEDITSSQESVFASIVQKNSWMANSAVKQIESTLAAAEQKARDWTRRAALGCVDIGVMCDEHIKNPEDWDLNFKACKALGQAVAKMSFDYEKIEWLSIGTASLRKEFEAQVRNLWIALISSLQNNCQSDVTAIEEFMANALVTLERKVMPKNARELAELSVSQNHLKEKMPEMCSMVDGLRKKQAMLRAWGGEQSIDGTIKEWQRINEMISSQEQLFEHQAETVKRGLLGEWSNLSGNVEVWLSRWTQNKPKAHQLSSQRYIAMRRHLQVLLDNEKHWKDFVRDKDELMKECDKFNIVLEVGPHWMQAEQTVTEDRDIWQPFKEFDEGFEEIRNQEWIVFQKKLHLLDDFISDWRQKLEPLTSVSLFLQQEIEKYKEIVPMLKYLKGSDFTETHWREIFGLLEILDTTADTLTVGDILDVSTNIKQNIHILQKISSAASSESVIRSAVNELELWFAAARFSIAHHKDKQGQPVPIIKDYKDIINKVKEQQSLVSSVRHAGADSGWDVLVLWEQRLRHADTTLSAMAHVQRKWLYLEPILSGGSELGEKFARVDRDFRQVMRSTSADVRLAALLQSPRLPSLLDSILQQLASCQAALDEYISDKRRAFPRFYFLSDDDLLELLGQARAGSEGREEVLQTHLKKLFPGATGVKLGSDATSIAGLCSHHGEVLLLDSPVHIDVAVEVWLQSLEQQMRKSLCSSIQRCLDPKTFDLQDPFSFPTQVLCLAQNIRFSQRAEKSMQSKDLLGLKDNIAKERNSYINIEGSEEENEGERNKRQALVLQCTHYLHILDELVDNRVVSPSHWLWQKQLRFYVLANSEVIAKMGLAKLSYSYEYLGTNTGQLVRTELTDQCFLILTQALHLGLAGNPFGPAGTGKTESVKALGGLLGRLVLVFNCDEAMDAYSVSRLLTGLALSGSWGCFDEFNRLTAETLAAVSRPLTALLGALAAKNDTRKTVAVLNQQEVSVSSWCGIFCTMNPAGGSYGGRRQLPSTLSSVLRPVAMWTPRRERIAAALLAARGATSPEQAATKLALTFRLARDLLRPLHHYDWGLRALKSVIGTCGAGLGLARSTNDGRGPDLQQQMDIIVKAIRLNTVSKLSYQDIKRFNAILSTVFPGVSNEDVIPQKLKKAIETSYIDLNLKYNTDQIRKCVELHEQLHQRMGVAIVGSPGSGKTTVRHLLKHALIQLGHTIKEHTICAKAISHSQLLGYIDPDTRQWTDGVISSTALNVFNEPSNVWSWVVCDGDVDPEWIESLNSVLDDNRLLTLPSGWRVQFGANVNFLFETHDLQHASPATISRLGIILLSEEECCVREAIETWGGNDNTCIPLTLVQSLLSAVSWSLDSRSEFLHPLHTMALIHQVLSQYKALEQKSKEEMSDIVTTEDMAAVAMMRGVGTMLKPKSYQIFMLKVSDWLGVSQHMLEFKPLDSSVSRVPNSDLCSSPRIAAAIEILRPWVENGSHFMIIGGNACGKNILVEHLLRDMYDKSMVTIQCTPALQPAQIVQTLKLKMAIRSGSGDIDKMSNSRSLLLLVTSLHRAHVDIWGTSAVQSFLLQIIQHGGFWDSAPSHLSDGSVMHWYKLRGIQVVMTARFAAQTKLCTRLTNAVHTMLLREPEDEELPQICRLHLEKSLSAIDKKLKYDVKNASQSMFSLYTEVVDTFVNRPHYKWTTSDLTNWCSNLHKYKITDAQSVTQAIREESNFIFRDRLVVDRDKQLFDSLAQKYFPTQSGSCYIPIAGSHGVQLEMSNENDWNKLLQKTINQCISEGDNKIFGDYEPECCLEISALCTAAARSTCGSVLVALGSAGLGRRGAAQLAATMLQAKLISVTTRHDFRTHIKNAIVTSGLEEQKVIVVISEDVSSHHSVLAMVESGTHQLLEQLDLNNTHTNQTKQLTDDEIASNVKENLGIVLLLDKDQSNLSDVLERYPMLYQKCHMLWIDAWDARTLRQMPQFVIQRLRQEIFLQNSESHEENEVIPIDAFVSIHSSMTAVHLSAPCRYVSFIKAYFHIQRQKKVELNKRQTTLKAGVAALQKARAEVSTLKTDAASQEKALSEKQAKASHALNQISATVQSATAQREEMQILKQNIQMENEKLQQRKKVIEEELATVEPVIAAARQAVGDIRPESLSEIRSLRAPPEVVRDVLEGVLRLMGVGDTSWHSMKTFLSKRGVKEDIRLFDASHTSAESLASVERLVSVRGSSFTEAASRRASAACAPLATWVKANLAYGRARAKVQPLEMEQRNLHQNLEQAESQLEALSSDLQTVDERVSSLKDQLNRYTKEGLEIEFKLNDAKATIAKTEELVDKLSSEYDTWEENLKELSTGCTENTMRSVLAAACVVYLSDKTDGECSSAIRSWCAELSYDPGSYSVPHFLSSPEQQLQWNANGLSNDATALKNAVNIHQILAPVKCGLTPLIIDPDGDAGRWLRRTLSGNSCEFVSAYHERFHTTLQHAVRFGKVLVIEDVNSVEEWWSPLLFGQMASHDKFRLLLWSRDASLPARVAPHQRALLAILNFAPQLQGLTDQLILFALEHNQPEIKEKLKSLKVEKASLQRQQYQLQENLLSQLSNSAGVDILHDSSLLSSLTLTRSSTSAIEASLTSAATLEAEVTSKTSAYRPSARHAALMLLCVRDLAATKFPLISMRVETLLELYVKALDDARVGTKSDTLDNDVVTKKLLSSMLDRVTLALHKQHRCTVTLHLLRHIFPQDISDEYWNVFTGNVTSYPKVHNETEILHPSWITGDCVKKCTLIKNCLPEYYDSLRLTDTKIWKAFMENGDLQSIPGQLSAFQKVIVVQALKPEKLYIAVNNVMEQLLGRALSGTGASARGAADPLGAALRWRRGSGKTRPVLVVGARGTDPTQQVIANAAASEKLIQVWVNEKESETMSGLRDAVSRATQSGAWVVLVVGAGPWFTTLQTFIVNGTEHLDQDPQSGFCLWIVSEDRDVPPLVANSCISIVLEAPEGIRNNMMRTLSLWGDYSASEPRTARLMFSLALLHSVVQERRAYIPQGWTLWYEFEWCDIQAGYNIILSRVDPQTAMGLIGALYGGRVRSAGDARVLLTLMQVLTGDGAAGHGWKPPGTSVHLPTDNRIQAYLEATYSFPGTDSPAQLGLAHNARTALDIRAANQLVSGLKQLQHLTETQDGEDVSSVKRSMAPILSLWKKLNSGPNSIIRGHSPTHKLDKKKSVRTHGWWEELWDRELSLAEAVCRSVHVTLSAVAKGDRALAATLMKDEIPSEWQRLWAGPDAVIPYIMELSHRATEAMKRNNYVDGADNVIDIDLRSLLSPACVWGALLGATAELLQTGPESLRLRAHWGNSAKPPTGVFALSMRGVCLEGARWCEEGACVMPPTSPSCPARALAPPILLYYTAHTQGSTNMSRGPEIPLYSNAQRSTPLLWLDVPLKGYSDHAWTLNAAALYIAEI